jgi:putative transposase
VSIVVSLLYSLRLLLRSRAALHLEILALRHQLAIVKRTGRPRLCLTTPDRVFWAWLTWGAWRSALTIVRPETVLAWHRRGFRLFWAWKTRRRTGRPTVPPDVRALIRQMSTANPLWGARRIHGELQNAYAERVIGSI